MKPREGLFGYFKSSSTDLSLKLTLIIHPKIDDV
jgi:hypothetical protein